MSKKKYYAVKVGKNPGIYQTWVQAEEQIKGFSGADFKSFKSLKEAENYILSKSNDDELKSDLDNEDINAKVSEEIKGIKDNEVIAFVDGSYSSDAEGKEKYGFGVVLITKGSQTNLFKAYINKEFMDSHNVAGEIEGVKQAILWSINNNKKSIKIYYDYEGIEKWAKKQWRANKKITRDYVKFYDEKSRIIDIKFEHVKAHSGIYYNELADDLAKRSLLSEGYKTYSDGTVYFIGFGIKEWLGIIDSLSADNEEIGINNKIETEIVKVKDYLNRIIVTSGNNRLVINCYRGNKSFVQGKQSVLFQKIISYAITQLPNEHTVIETLNTYHALTIDEIDVQNEFNNMLPNFPDDFSDVKHYNNLLTAVFNTMLVGFMPDYTCLITPIFRALEYYLHRILHDKLGKNTERDNGQNNFAYFNKDKNTEIYMYNSEYNGLKQTQIDFLNELYNFYNRVRHPYSHWSQNSIDSAVITEMSVARDLIIEGLTLVDRYYKMF